MPRFERGEPGVERVGSDNQANDLFRTDELILLPAQRSGLMGIRIA